MSDDIPGIDEAHENVIEMLREDAEKRGMTLQDYVEHLKDTGLNSLLDLEGDPDD